MANTVITPPQQAYYGLCWKGLLGPVLFWPQTRGYITSTPKSADFREKQRKWPKNERASCIPRAKNGERPYLAGPKTLSGTPILGLIFALLLHFNP